MKRNIPAVIKKSVSYAPLNLMARYVNSKRYTFKYRTHTHTHTHTYIYIYICSIYEHYDKFTLQIIHTNFSKL